MPIEEISITSLPLEILEMIFQMLPICDLMAVVLVCKYWRDIGQRPCLWTSCTLKVDRRGELHKMQIGRLQHLQTLIVGGYWWETRELEELFRCAALLQKLKSVSVMRYVNISNVDPDVLATATTKLEELDINDSQLTHKQLETLLRNVSDNLKRLFIGGTNLQSIDPETLSTALNKLEVVNLFDCLLTNQQTEELFAKMSGGTNLRKARLSYNDLSSIDPDICGTQVNNLEVMHLENTELTAPQVEKIFAKMNVSTNLKDLDISCNNLSTIEPGVLASGLNKVEVVSVANCFLTIQQVQTTFATMKETTRTMKLVIAMNNLTFTDPIILAEAVNKLTEVDMSRTNMTVHQVESILEEAMRGTQLLALCLDQDLVKQVDSRIMGQVNMVIRV